MDYGLLIEVFYIIGCLFNLYMLGEYFVEAWKSPIHKLIVIMFFSVAVGLSWFYYLVGYVIKGKLKR